MEEWRRKKIEEVYTKWEKRERHETHRADPSRRSAIDRSIPRPPRHTGSSGCSFSRRKRQQKAQSLQEALAQTRQGFVPSLAVDMSALHAVSNNKYTSISRCCQKCVPISKTKFYSEDFASVGLRNMLIVDRRKQWGLFGHFFPYTSHVIFTDLKHSHLNDVRKDTFNSKRVQAAIDECARAAVENDPDQYERAIKEQEKRASNIIQGMSAGLCKGLIRVLAWLMYLVAGYLYNRIDIQNRHVHMLKAAQEHGVPLVFLPSHKSHMDYILMTFILLNSGIHPPRIAAGDNLRLPFISWLVTHLGGFFIKRKLDTAAGKDVLYRKCLHEFMEQSLSAGNNMEFFIEGSRSRSGKANSPKAGLLSVLVDSVQEGVVEDIIIVPVAIAYDKLLERRFVRHELMGGSKRPETVMQVIRGAWAMLTQNTGSVRVDFAQPFSLQEYLSTECVSSDSLMELSNVIRSRSILNMAECSQRKLVTALSQHVTYDFTHCASLMSTHMVSFLLLTKHRQGITCSQLVESYQWLERAAASRGRSVGFTGDASEAVHYALHYLGDLVEAGDGTKRSGRVSCDQILQPHLQLPDVFELLHHGNQVTPMFILESVVASSIHQLVGEELRQGGMDVVEVSREEVLEGAVFLCQLLAREFIFAPPCVGVRTALGDTIDSLVNCEILRVPVSPTSSFGGRRLPRPVLDSDEEDEPSDVMLHVSTDSRAAEYLMFLQSILSPFLESYWHSALALLQLEKDIEELTFLCQLHTTLVEKAEKGLLSNVESCSMDSLRNAVKSFVDMDLVSYKSGTTLHVSNAKQLLCVAEDIVEFKC